MSSGAPAWAMSSGALAWAVSAGRPPVTSVWRPPGHERVALARAVSVWRCPGMSGPVVEGRWSARCGQAVAKRRMASAVAKRVTRKRAAVAHQPGEWPGAGRSAPAMALPALEPGTRAPTVPEPVVSGADWA